MTLLRASGIVTSFETGRGTLRAVDHVDLALDRGRVLGLVGESGSGKSVLVRSIMGLVRLDDRAQCAGTIEFDGVALDTLAPGALRRLWGKRIAIVFQDPLSSLNPVVQVGRQIAETIRHHLDVPRQEAAARALDLLQRVEIPDPQRRMREYPHQMSGGMRQRVAIAIALSAEPELLIADEPTTALDVTVQAQVLGLLRRLQIERDMAMIFVSHDLGVVSNVADEIAVMYGGRVVEHGTREQVIGSPRHPYTHALLRSVPRVDLPLGTRLLAIEGRPPNPLALPSGCAFHPRCGNASAICVRDQPALGEEDDGRRLACWNPVRDRADSALVGRGESDHVAE